MKFVVLFLLMILDYILTKIGISLGVITEGNKLMSWLMEMPFYLGLIIRMGISSLVIYPIYLAEKMKCQIYKIALILGFIAYSAVMILHSIWIILYIWG